MKLFAIIFILYIGYCLACDKPCDKPCDKQGGQNSSSKGGVVYTRWGRKGCPDDPDTSLVYQGVAVSSKHNDRGGGANYICLPNEPQYWPGGGNSGAPAYLYGAEYEGTVWGASIQDYTPPCAVCYTANKGTTLMIPAKTQCPAGWHTEYGGYLITKSAVNHSYAVFICLDGNPEVVPNSKKSANTVEASFHHVKATCRGMKCPPYNTNKEIACVVCSK